MVCLYSQFHLVDTATTDNPKIWTATKVYLIIGTGAIKETKESNLEGDHNNTRWLIILWVPPQMHISLIFHIAEPTKKERHSNAVFLSKDQLTKKKDRILIKDLISNKWKYKTKKQGWFYWRRKAVPSEILVKRLYIPDCKISLAFFSLILKCRTVIKRQVMGISPGYCERGPWLLFS